MLSCTVIFLGLCQLAFSSELAVPGSNKKRANYDPCPDFMVESIVSDKADMSGFDDMMRDIEDIFPHIYFDEINVEDSDNAHQIVPAIRILCKDKFHKFNYVMTKEWVERWIRDAKKGHFSLLRVIPGHEAFHDDFEASVHIMSKKPPNIEPMARHMPSIGFAWTRTNGSRFRNTILVQDVFGRYDMRHDYRYNHILHLLLPPIIPYEVAVHPVGNEIMTGTAEREVHIVCDCQLPKFWNSFVLEYPATAFVQFNVNETNMPNNTVWYFHRSVQFKHQSVEEGVEDWFGRVAKGVETPFFRLSTEPTPLPLGYYDVTGNNLWDWIHEHRDIFLVLRGDSPVRCNLEKLQNVGSMDIRTNDHELLPDDAVEGMILHILDHGRNIIIKNCAQVTSGQTLAQIRKIEAEKRQRIQEKNVKSDEYHLQKRSEL